MAATQQLLPRRRRRSGRGASASRSSGVLLASLAATGLALLGRAAVVMRPWEDGPSGTSVGRMGSFGGGGSSGGKDREAAGIVAVPRAVPLAGGEEGGSNDGKGEGKEVDSDVGGSDMEEDGEEEGGGIEYLGHAGVPPGSCFRPHPYFRPAVPPGGRREGLAHGGDEGREGLLPLPLPLPLINLGFPKAGTNTLEMFFRCGMEGDEERDDGGGGGGKRRRRRRGMAGGLNISHMTCLSRPDSDFCGRCMHGAVAAAAGGGGGGHPGPLAACGSYALYTQIDHTPGGNGTRPCHWPQVDLLDEIHAESPEATFLLTMRDFDAWYGSMAGWNGYDQRLGRCRLGAYPGGIHDPQGGGEEGGGGLRESLRSFYCDQVERVRGFVLRHPSHALVEVDVSDLATGPYLGGLFGIDPGRCWGMHNVNPARAVLDGEAGLVHAAAASNLTVRFAKVPPRARKGLIKQARDAAAVAAALVEADEADAGRGGIQGS